MGQGLVKTHMNQAKITLAFVSKSINGYLNETTVSQMVSDCGDYQEYYEDVLFSLRRISVFCDEGHGHCTAILGRNVFQEEIAERALNWIYNRCIEEFYHPRNDYWHEDSRALYRGKSAIQFNEHVPVSLKELMSSLEKSFQEIREELEYYGNQLQAKMG
jgi:hypothetical protein